MKPIEPKADDLLDRIHHLEMENDRLLGLLKEREVLIDQIPDCIVHYALDASGQPVSKYVSPQITNITGYDLDFIAQEGNEFAIIHPNDLPWVKEAFRGYFTQGQKNDPIEYRIIHKSGEIRWIREQVTLISEKDNSQLVGVKHDITKVKSLEISLEKREQRYKTIFENIQDVFYETDNNGIIVEVSPSVSRFSKYSREDLLGKPITKLYQTPEMREEFLKRLAIEGKITDLEVEGRDKDGSIVNGVVNVQLLRDNQGMPIGTVGSFRDVTSSKKAEEQLKESELRFSLLLETASNIAVQGYSSDGTVGYWNKASEELYGYTAEEAIGKNLLDLIIPLRMREEVSQNIATMILSGVGGPPEEMLLMRKDGSYVPVISNHTVISFPGKEAELFCIDIDLTHRRKAEEALVASEAKYRTLFEANRDGISIFSVHPDGSVGLFEEMNIAAAEMLGYTKEELLQLTPTDLEMSMNPKMLIDRQTQLETKGFFNFETNLKHKAGHYLNVEIMAVLIQYQGRFAIMNIVRDISERKKAEQGLRQSELILREAQEVARVGHYVYDIQTGTWESSLVLDEIFGIDSQYERNVDSWFDLVAPDQRDEMVQYLDKCIQEYGRFKKDYKILRISDKMERWVSGLGEIEYDAEGKPIRMMGTIQDITERIQTQQEVVNAKERAEQSEQRFRLSETQLKVKLDRILSSDVEMPELNLTDIIDLDQLQLIQDAFTKATGVASVITDLRGLPITKPSNFSGVCKLIRQTPLGQMRCEASDKQIGERCAITHTAHLESCHGCGFIDAGAPISIGNKLVAIWMIGQANQGDVSEESLIAYANEIGANPEALLAEYRQMPNMSKDQFNDITNLLLVFANELSSLAYQNILLARKIQEQKEDEDKLMRAKEVAEENERLVKEKNEAYWSLNEELTEANTQLEEFNEVIQEKAAKLKEREAILNSVINNIPFDLWARDLNGVCFLQNETSKSFWGPMQGKTPQDMKIPKETLDLWLKNNKRILGGATFNEELEFTDAFGVNRCVNSIVAPIVENNQILGFLGLDIDISQRKQFEREIIKAKEKAEESDRLKSSFLATMSHELRTPLNAIIGFSQILPGVQDLEKVTGFSHIINQQGKHLLGIIESMFEISLLDAGEVKVNIEQVEVVALLESLAPIAIQSQKKWNKTQLTVKFIAVEKLREVKINSDLAKLKQIMLNLIDNALKFTVQGTIEYGFTVSGDDAILFVKDTGKGIDPSNFNLIFSPFRQVDDGFSREFEGVGLGLAICQKMAALLNGEITVQSEVGKGSTFSLVLRGAIVRKDAPIQVEEDSLIVDLNLGGVTILVAEDDSTSQILIEDFISAANGTVIMTANGKEAVELALSNDDIALVLMNIKIPVMNGIEAMQRIKEAKPTLPVIALTAFAMPGDQAKLIYYGFDDYLSKPIESKPLNAKIIQYLLSN